MAAEHIPRPRYGGNTNRRNGWPISAVNRSNAASGLAYAMPDIFASSPTKHFSLMDAHPLTLLPPLLLGILLALAVRSDLRSRRIPNWLVLSGILCALALHALLPAGAGFFAATGAGALGPLPALGGMALGLCLLLPMYMLNAMGAGDVKLMAMVGAFTGPVAVAGAVIATLLAGGLLAVAVSLYAGTLARMLANSYQMLLHSVLGAISGGNTQVPAPAAVSGRLPYAIAIACGTVMYLGLAWRYPELAF